MSHNVPYSSNCNFFVFQDVKMNSPRYMKRFYHRFEHIFKYFCIYLLQYCCIQNRIVTNYFHKTLRGIVIIYSLKHLLLVKEKEKTSFVIR